MDNNHKNSDQLNMESKYLSFNYGNKIIILKYITCNVHLIKLWITWPTRRSFYHIL